MAPIQTTLPTKPPPVCILSVDAEAMPISDSFVKKLESPSPSTSSCSYNGPPELSTFRLLFAHMGAAMTLFLATTDATIVSTSLPTITSELSASHAQYTWVIVSYLLTQTAFQPLWGKLAALVGQKNILWSSIFIFAFGSLLCGVAKNIEWLIGARSIAGIGGGGIVSSVWVLTAQLVPETSRAKWSQALSITWACSAVSGPLLGGVFSGDNQGVLSWRWAFYVNLPICLCSCIVMVIALHRVPINETRTNSWRLFFTTFDFLGLALFMSGTSCVVVGFSFATEIGWSHPSTLILITLGPLILSLGIFYETRTKRDALFPPQVFSQLPIIAILALTFLHNAAFTAGTFYLALYYQAVNGATPIQAGIYLLPYSLGSSLASIPVSWFLEFWQRRRKGITGQQSVLITGFICSTVGFGLMILLDARSSSVIRVLYPLIAAIGVGMLFHAPFQTFTRALGPEMLATGTSAFFLVRFTGSIIGLAVAGAIFYGKASGALQVAAISDIHKVEPLVLRFELEKSISSALQAIWAACCGSCGAALLLSVFIPYRQLERTQGTGGVINEKSTRGGS